MQIRNDMEKVRKPSEEWISTYWSEFELSVLLMTVKCIKKLRNSNELMQDWKEVDYSYELCTLMDDYCYVNELSISPRCEEVIPEEEKSVSEYPRIDIKIRWHQHISVIYYAIEAKVLVNKIGIRSYSRASLANEYVINGMRRFVS